MNPKGHIDEFACLYICTYDIYECAYIYMYICTYMNVCMGHIDECACLYIYVHMYIYECVHGTY